MFSHSAVLFIAYSTVALLWIGVSRVAPYWRHPERPNFAHPWRELGFAFLAVVVVLLIGQLYVRGIRLPTSGLLRPLTESLNQTAIFLPVLLLPLFRRQRRSTLWVPAGDIPQRIAVGVGLALVAFGLVLILEEGVPGPAESFGRLLSWGSIPLAVQVLLEDLTIALIAVRLGAAISPKWAVVITAVLFAAGHIPAMVATGVAPREFGGLVRDAALGGFLVAVLYRSGDIMWFWPVHTVLDASQFLNR